MTQLTIRINGYGYNVACEDGQESHAQAMAQEVDNRISSIKALGGQSGESRLLVLAALLMADELHDLGIELATLRKSIGEKAGQPQHQASVQAPAQSAAPPDMKGAERLTRLVRRAEEIAAEMERA